MSKTHSNAMARSTGLYAGIQPSPLPPLDRYQVHRYKDVTTTALRRVVALRREGVGWATIAQGLMLPSTQIRYAYDHLPEELR